jgi:hypothetical protein
MTTWPDTAHAAPPRSDRYAATTWLLGRRPRLADLADRITGLVHRDADGPWINLHHLAEVLNAEPRYREAWADYCRRHSEPNDDSEWDRWRQAGPQPDEACLGLGDFLVMSSGEVAALRLLGTLAAQPVPFSAADLSSLDAEGQATLTDWTELVQL